MTRQRRRFISPLTSDNRGPARAGLAGLIAAFLLCGCDSDPSKPSSTVLGTDDAAGRDDGPGAGEFTALVAPSDTVAVVRPGHKLVLPVTPEPGFAPGAGAIVRLDDGTRVKARLWWVGVKLAPWDQRVSASTDPIRAWLAESPGSAGGWGVWSAAPGPEVQPEAAAGAVAAEAGQWILVADLPRSSKAQRLWVGDAPSPGVPIVWWTGLEPEHLALFGPRDTPMWVRSPWLTRTLAAAAASPLTRWRADLVGASLGVRTDGPPGGDPVLDLLAERLTMRWTVALLRLEAIDATLARRVLWTAAGVADFGGAIVAPLWTDDSAELAALVAGVLDPMITDEQAAERAEAWLSSQSLALAWIIDDAGAAEPSTLRPVVTIGVLNRATTTEPASIEPESARGAAVFAATPPVSTRRVTVPVPREETGAPATRMNIRMNEREFARAASAAPAPVAPPGLRVGPLVRDWTHARFVAAAADPEPGPSELGVIDAQWSTAALLQRAATGGGGGGGAGGGSPDRPGAPHSEWTLYVECRVGTIPDAPTDGSATDPQRDSVRLWLGPHGAPSLVLRISGDGKTEIEDTRARAGAGGGGGGAGGDWPSILSSSAGVTVRRTETGWACWIPVPSAALEPDGTIKIALERTDSRGVRTAWPRAMLPWQREPGRAWADLSTWEGESR